MKVLSLFDGMACGRIALEQLGIPVEKYYASEIDKYAIQVAQANYPDIIQVGDVCDLDPKDYMDVDLIQAGSPCQGFSMAGKQLAFDDPRSALFFEFIRLLKAIKPKYFLLENVKLELGFALGLFAIFGIIRYRTDAIPIKEMTYLFIVIGISVMNALVNKKISHAEVIFTNMMFIAITYGLEKIWLLKHESRKNITFEKIELILPERKEELLADLRERTGLNITRVEIRNVDFLRDTANLRIFYFEDEQK